MKPYSVYFTHLLRSIRRESVTTNEGKAALRKESWSSLVNLHGGHDTDNLSECLLAGVEETYHSMVVFLLEGSKSVSR
jgi:hypothetical protein